MARNVTIDREEFVRAVGQGLTRKEIALKLGCEPATVLLLARQCGVELVDAWNGFWPGAIMVPTYCPPEPSPFFRSLAEHDTLTARLLEQRLRERTYAARYPLSPSTCQAGHPTGPANSRILPNLTRVCRLCRGQVSSLTFARATSSPQKVGEDFCPPPSRLAEMPQRQG